MCFQTSIFKSILTCLIYMNNREYLLISVFVSQIILNCKFAHIEEVISFLLNTPLLKDSSLELFISEV